LSLVPYLRLYRRWIVESPRFSHLSAVPVVKAPGCPFTLRPRYRRRSVSRLPQMLILRHRLVNSPSLLGFAPSGRLLRISGLLRLLASGFVDRSIPKSPWFLLSRRRRFRPLRVAPKLSSSADPYLLPQVAPASTSTAGSMITPWLNRTLHPRLAPWMNLRYQSGTSIPDLTSSAILISICRSQSADHELKPKPLLALSTRPELPFQSATESPAS
jgi:hypothetical protein